MHQVSSKNWILSFLNMATTFTSYVESQFGVFRLEASEEGLSSVTLVKEMGEGFPNQHSMQAAVQLSEYLDGDRKAFDLTLDIKGSDFYQSVWEIVYKIPYGKTLSYMDIARKLENPRAVRAVGMANGKNPIPIIVPCHRVIGSDGSLTGYALGIDMKQKLLALESDDKLGWQGSLFS